MISFLKQYQSPTAVLMQWWCLFAARRPRTALALKVMGLYLILAAVTDPVVHADDGQKSGGGDAFTMFLDTSNLKDKEGIEINRYSTLPLDRVMPSPTTRPSSATSWTSCGVCTTASSACP